MNTGPFWNTLGTLSKPKHHWHSKSISRSLNFFLGDVTEKRQSTSSTCFQKICPGIRTPTKEELINLGSPLRPNAQVNVLEKNVVYMEKTTESVEKLDAHCGFHMMKKCFSLPKVLFFLRTSTCFNHPALLEKNDKIVRDSQKCVS